MGSIRNQSSFRLNHGLQPQAMDECLSLVRQVETDGEAIAICMKAHKLKLAYVAARIGKSVSYVSRMRSGEREVPDKLVGPLCAALGSNLLAQVRDLRDRLNPPEMSNVVRLAALMQPRAHAPAHVLHTTPCERQARAA